jgi:hypothetical protein
MNSKLLCVVAGLSLSAGLAQEAHAALSYHYVSDQPTYNLSPGGAVVVQLYLQETPDGVTSSLLADNHGLGQGAVSVSRDSGDAKISNPAMDAAFDVALPLASTASTADLWGMSSGGSPVVDLGGGLSGVLIGTITIQAGSPGDTSQFTVMPNTSGGASVTFGPSTYNLDNPSDPGNPSDPPDPFPYTAASSSTFTVTTAVPEPVSLLTLALGSFLMLQRRQRA